MELKIIISFYYPFIRKQSINLHYIKLILLEIILEYDMKRLFLCMYSIAPIHSPQYIITFTFYTANTEINWNIWPNYLNCLQRYITYMKKSKPQTVLPENNHELTDKYRIRKRSKMNSAQCDELFRQCIFNGGLDSSCLDLYKTLCE